ncbi:mycofactocin precursor MftA [Haloarchaeobius amylolyticus]|uniref:Mycofactocin MftA n=1 Tax=Haloarchaeobius amylolyticus TaxID=1198296 RepID=A0ABD6BIC4_9EURY
MHAETAQSHDEAETDSDEQPEIEADLFEEELRIDGICGVY